MAPKTKKGLKGSIDDVLGDLLGDDTTLPEKPVKAALRARDAADAPQGLPSPETRTKSLLEDDVFRTGLAGADAKVSDISDADPQALLQALQDLDDMDADLLGLKKSSVTSGQRLVKESGKEELPTNPQPAAKPTANENGNTVATKKPSPNSFGHQHRGVSFEDLEDPLAGLLLDEEGAAQKPTVTESKTASGRSPSRGQAPSIPLTPGDTPVRKKEELLFDDGEDIMASLGFGDSPKAERKQTPGPEVPRPARSKLDELLGRGTATQLLARPGTGEHREFKLAAKYQRPQDHGHRPLNPDKEDTWGDKDFTFGAYQPTMGSSEGRQSRRQSVRFLAEGGPEHKGEPGSKQSPPVTSSPSQPRKGGADWLGLKDDDLDLLPPSPTREARRGGSVLATPSTPPPASQHPVPGRHSAPAGLSTSGAKPPAEGAGSPAKASQASKLGAPEEKDGEDWLSHALSRKKSQSLAREERAGASKGWNSRGTGDHPPPGRYGLGLLYQLEGGSGQGPPGPA